MRSAKKLRIKRGFKLQTPIMKIAIVASPYVPVPPAKYGGTERVIAYLIKGLKEAGHEPILIGPGDSQIDCQIIPSVDQALWFPRHKGDVKEHRKKAAVALKRTEAIIQSIASTVDVIHSHDIDMLKFKNLPTVTTLHGPITFELIPYYLRRRTLPYVFISKNQTKVLPNMNAIGVVYNGMDPAEFPIVNTPKNYVSFIGRFDREKNPHLAIKLALSLGLDIKLAGKIDYLGDGYFEEFIEPHFKNPKVHYLGEIGLDEKIELLSNALCNLHPTGFREPFGLTVLEAAYCGTPTLAISRGSMPELIINDQTGVLVEDFEEGFMAFEKARKLDRIKIAEYARSTFNYNNMARDYVRMYEKTIQMHEHTPLMRRLLRKVNHSKHQVGQNGAHL